MSGPAPAQQAELTVADAAEEPGDFRHWSVRIDAQSVAWLLLDVQSDDGEPASVNTVSGAVLEELDAVLDLLESRHLRGLILRSTKPAGFGAGADIHEFGGLGDAASAASRLREANRVVDRLANLGCPTVCVVHGHCLGAGLEIALACDQIIAIAGAQFGFPEVQLGLHPGLGGTVRLPRRINPAQAMALMLTGRSVPANRARALGLADVVIEERHVLNAVNAAVVRPPRTRAWLTRLLGTAPARRLIGYEATRTARKRANPAHYPAPFAMIDRWVESGGSAASMAAAETESFANLLTTPTAQNLIRVYLLRERMRSAGRVESGAIERVHVVGAGVMGAGIAAWCAARGLQVTVEDPSRNALARCMGEAATLFGKILEPREAARAWDRLAPDFRCDGRGHADLVIEAVPERVDLKQQVLSELEDSVRDGAIIATNTSALPLDQLTSALRKPERFAGLHFFNPVSRMPLIEVVTQPSAGDGVIRQLQAFAIALNRVPVLVASRPGFLVNRTLTPYLLEAVAMLDEGVAPERIDIAAESFGMPVGPVALLDQIGLDVALHVAKSLDGQVPGSFAPVPDWLLTRVEAGHLGAKSGRGLYRYGNNGEKLEADIPRDVVTQTADVDRLILPMVNTAIATLYEGVAADADTVDAAMIFGAGFAPFRGGPLQYARTTGGEAIRAKLRDLARQHGDRFDPLPGWEEFLTS